MENMYNATVKSGASVSNVAGGEKSAMTNPLKRNRMVPPSLDGVLASKEYSDAVYSMAMAQMNLPKYNVTPVYYQF